jgi:hypothetical protein
LSVTFDIFTFVYLMILRSSLQEVQKYTFWFSIHFHQHGNERTASALSFSATPLRQAFGHCFLSGDFLYCIIGMVTTYMCVYVFLVFFLVYVIFLFFLLFFFCGVSVCVCGVQMFTSSNCLSRISCFKNLFNF